MQILSAYITSNSIALAQEAIHQKTDEIPVLHIRVLKAGLSQRVRYIASGKPAAGSHSAGDYLFGLTENRPPLLEDVRPFWECSEAVEKNARQIEKRI